jgi:galactose-1-phosphate uridylyltransferase
MAMIDEVKSDEFELKRKSSVLKKLATNLLTRWRRISDDRQQLWLTYATSPYACSTPRRIWRRHGAMLMYARSHKPNHSKPVKQRPYC